MYTLCYRLNWFCCFLKLQGHKLYLLEPININNINICFFFLLHFNYSFLLLIYFYLVIYYVFFTSNCPHVQTTKSKWLRS